MLPACISTQNLLTNAIKFTTQGAVELFLEAIPLTHEAAVAAELPAEAFDWAFGKSVVAVVGPSSKRLQSPIQTR